MKALLFVPGAFIAAMTACAGREIVVDRGPYVGPAVSLESTGPRHMALFTVPSAGWFVRFDRGRRLFEGVEVYVTLTRPDPAYLHAQAEVTLNVDTNVESRENVVVYARILDFGSAAVPGPYRRAVASTLK